MISAPLDIAGEPFARVRVRSSAQSYDVFVRITDVHPDGRAMTVTDGIRRIGSVGTADSDPEPDEDGYREVTVPLWPTFHRFAPGHRVGIQISSRRAPAIRPQPWDRNGGVRCDHHRFRRSRPRPRRWGRLEIELPVWTH